MNQRSPENTTDEENQADKQWALGVAKEWIAELSDPRQDVYTLEDGQPLISIRANDDNSAT